MVSYPIALLSCCACCLFSADNTSYIVNRPRNGYEIIGNIKVVSIDTFKQLEVANKAERHKRSCIYTANIALSCTHKEASFVSLDDLHNISILLDKYNDLEQEITHLFNKVFLF